MSTYYTFICKEHNKQGGFLSRQAWGTGNFDIIETFKFLALHKDCKPYLVSEHTDDYENVPQEEPQKFVEETRGYMPHSNDWELVKNNEWKDVEKKWEEVMLPSPTKDREEII
jgi:hypothetical protein